MPWMSSREMSLTKSMDLADISTEAYISRDREGMHAFLNEEIGRLDLEDFEGFSASSFAAMDKVKRVKKGSAPTVPWTGFG